MANLQGIRRNITDVAMVCTEKQFADLYATDPSFQDKEYVRLEVNQIRGALCGGVQNGPLQHGSVAVVPNTCSAHYLSFLLCSLPGQLFLFSQKFNVLAKAVVNKKIVSTLSVFEVEKESEEAYASADILRDGFYKQYLNDQNNLGAEHVYRLVADLCDMLALELYAHPLFEEKGIYILENWKAVIVKKEDGCEMCSAIEALADSSSPLRNEIMKAHILVHDVKDYIKK